MNKCGMPTGLASNKLSLIGSGVSLKSRYGYFI